MKRKDWAPTPYQYLCSDHFTPESFERRWGIRYLKPDAVPTIFSFPDQPTKTKAAARTDGLKRMKKPSRKVNMSETQCGDERIETAALSTTTIPILSTVMSVSGDELAVQVIETESTVSTPMTELDTVTISSTDACDETLSEAMETSIESLPNASAVPFEPFHIDSSISSDSVLTEPPLSPFDNEPSVETIKLSPPLSASVEALQLSTQEEPEETTAITLTPVETIVPAETVQIYESLPSFQSLTSTPVTSLFEATTAVPCFHTLPSPVLPFHAPQLFVETPTIVAGVESVLTLPSAITTPIMSTLSIECSVSSAPPIAAVETVVTTQPDELPDTTEVQGEHSYHKNDLTTEQLGEIMLSLQKKVKILHQRERRNSARLKVMENLVEQLKKENILSEEKLKLLEMTSLQTKSQGADRRRTVTIICHEDDDTIIYALPESGDEESSVVIEEGHIKLENFD
uniref:THAP domain-containing protein 5-like protein n=1 Tax=Callorhinchus milii TaxID=7868 RepID=V9KJ73_CALMI